MSFNPTLFVVFVIVLLQTCFTEADHTMSETDLVESTNGFALEMYTKLAEVPGSFFFSPFSIFSALFMTSLGAKENTLNEMLKTMKIENYDKDVVQSWYKRLSQVLLNEESQQYYTLSLANRLFGEKSYTFLNEFLQDTSKYYSAQLESLDFKEKFEESRRHINDFVSRKTNDKIKDMLAPGVIDSITSLVLVNAIYFKGDWFSASYTKESNYFLSEKEMISVPLMHKEMNASYGFSDALQCQVLELPYKEDGLSMVVLLPDVQQTTLAQLENSLTPSALFSLDVKMSEVDVWLPKFKIESSFNLNEQLKQMGMADLFSAGGADLSGMAGTRDLYVSLVEHKGFVEVNEEGSEAAADFISTRYSQFIPEFKANHPFLFFIGDPKTSSILFFGRFIKP